MHSFIFAWQLKMLMRLQYIKNVGLGFDHLHAPSGQTVFFYSCPRIWQFSFGDSLSSVVLERCQRDIFFFLVAFSCPCAVAIGTRYACIINAKSHYKAMSSEILAAQYSAYLMELAFFIDICRNLPTSFSLTPFDRTTNLHSGQFNPSSGQESLHWPSTSQNIIQPVFTSSGRFLLIVDCVTQMIWVWEFISLRHEI